MSKHTPHSIHHVTPSRAKPWLAALIGSALALALALPAQAQVLRFAGALSAAAEVPPNDSRGTGEVTATLDLPSRLLVYQVRYSGLTGPATAAHFHGPAAAGATAPPVLPAPHPGPAITAAAVLTDDQVAGLSGGRWYFNVHTQAHPQGELRGQLFGVP